MHLKRTLSLCLFALAGLPLTGATIKPESVGLSEERLSRIHDTMQRHIDSHDISGAVTLVARKGQIAWFHAQGLMDIEANKPMQKDAFFRVFSMSKPVCGVAILMLLEEGKVRLNDPVSKFIPEFKGSKVAVVQDRPANAPASDPPKYYTIPAAREITIQDLLTHVSGLASGGQASSHELPGLIDMMGGRTLADMMPKFAAAPLDFQPGSRWTYSPLAGFDTLGRVVEVASGMSFDQFLRERIFTPLGMKTTAFHPGDDRWSSVVTAYHRADGTLAKTENPNRLQSKTYFSGAGGLVSTAEEYAQFALMLCRRRPVEWQAATQPEDRGTDVLRVRARHTPGARAGPRLWTERRSGQRSGRRGPPRFQGQLRLGRSLRHPLLGRPARETHRRDDDPDRQPGPPGGPGLRKRRHAGDRGVDHFCGMP